MVTQAKGKARLEKVENNRHLRNLIDNSFRQIGTSQPVNHQPVILFVFPPSSSILVSPFGRADSQSVSQSFSQSISYPVNQSVKKNQSISKVGQSISHPVSQSVNQSIS